MEKVFDNDFLTVSLAKRRSSSATSSELSCSSDERSAEELKQFEVTFNQDYRPEERFEPQNL